MSAIELAWAAGLWDGEGSSGCYPYPATATQPARTLVTAKLTQAGIDVPVVLTRFQDAVGFGRVRSEGTRPIPNRRPMWAWLVSRLADVEMLAECLGPYLSPVKVEQLHETISAGRVWVSRSTPTARLHGQSELGITDRGSAA